MLAICPGYPAHCSTVIDTPYGPLVAAYCGQEMSPEQRVYVTLPLSSDPMMTFVFSNAYEQGRSFQYGTGNPLLWKNQLGSIFLLYSDFDPL